MLVTEKKICSYPVPCSFRTWLIHTFSDASEKAYAAASYVCHEYEDGAVSTRLVAAMSRLAPLKTMSIPRLELIGALTGLRLTLKICVALGVPC